MGCGSSVPVDVEAEKRNAQIEKQLAEDKAKMRKETKLLFLGAGESGKSTIQKQFQLQYGKPYTDEQRREYRDVIYDNSLRSMQVIIDALSDILALEIPANLNDAVEFIMSFGEDPELAAPDGEMDPKLARALSQVWAFEGAKEAVEVSHEFQLNDSASYYFDNIPRLAQPGYLPSDQDILRSRVKSVGIAETVLDVGGRKLRLVDVGGQRSERRKWQGVFEDVEVLLFLISISEYNQVLYEDETVSRFSEATTLWSSIANSRWFSRTNVILFLNKIDLFQQKLPVYPLSDYVTEYKGPNDYHSTSSYLVKSFGSLYTNPAKELIVHLTCATDAAQVRPVLAAIQDQIVASNILAAGML
ncbi:guanine nucleotide-binding protein subunit alpha [Sporobolomyces salmoneus]|uniref:guanine nucleotide-binding protein subunit alpha n=1 Tax=Sporobolomyces salmoneus TaxID=183962 RepID=UPI0031817722